MPSRGEQLERACEDVAAVQKRIEDQVMLIDRLSSDGHDTQAAERLLRTFLDLMSKLTVHREELERETEERSRSAN